MRHAFAKLFNIIFAGFGFACHLGVLIDIPTIGIAKKMFNVDGLEKSQVPRKYHMYLHFMFN